MRLALESTKPHCHDRWPLHTWISTPIVAASVIRSQRRNATAKQPALPLKLLKQGSPAPIPMLTQATLPSQGISKTTKPSIAQINRRVALARARAKKAAFLADETAVNENTLLLNTGVKRTAVVSVRMSSKGFGVKDPRHALRILQSVSIDDMETYVFADLGLTSFKYHVSSVAKRLVDASLYRSVQSAAMPSTQAIRYLYEVALEIESGAPRELICWHSAQQLLQGRASRGVGIVAANADAKVLLITALAVCIQRVQKRVDAANIYEQEMNATAAACSA